MDIQLFGDDSVFVQYGDRRVLEYPLMESPLGLFGLLTLYFLVVYRWGPSYMANRTAFNIKWILGVYNLFQVLACAFLVQRILSHGLGTLIFWRCTPVDRDRESPHSRRLLHYMYLTFLLKLIELVETLFFVMRKKNNQISRLHVYHHVSTVLLSWTMVKFVGGGMILFSVVLNSCVHILMYGYYFAALFGPRVQRRLEPVKRRITLVQMVQFCLIVTQCSLGLYQECDMPRVLVYIYIPNVLFIFYMFYKFFQRAYAKRPTAAADHNAVIAKTE